LLDFVDLLTKDLMQNSMSSTVPSHDNITYSRIPAQHPIEVIEFNSSEPCHSAVSPLNVPQQPKHYDRLHAFGSASDPICIEDPDFHILKRTRDKEKYTYYDKCGNERVGLRTGRKLCISCGDKTTWKCTTFPGEVYVCNSDECITSHIDMRKKKHGK
jgi:hypothetical protein